MSDYDTQRTNMVDSQLRTTDVTDHRILKAMLDVPRERFVPASRRGFAYMDQEIRVERDQTGADRYMMSPMTLAKLVQLADIGKDDMVLVVGCTSGYAAAIIANLADSVICVEQDEKLVEAASERLEALGCDNAATVVGSLDQGYSKEGPYDVIIINGGVESVPNGLFDQLKDHGRLVAVQVESENVGRAQLFRKIGDKVGGSQVSFDAYAHTLPGYARKAAFVF